VTACGAASPGHFSSHVEAPAHESEHEPVQVTEHVELPAQLMLLLAPTVTSHIDEPAQLMLHDLPHVPLHVLPFVHASEQLSPEQPELVMSHEVCAGHEHEVPLHVGGGGVELLPQATRNPITRISLTIDRSR